MNEKINHLETSRRFDLISIGELSKLTNVNIKSLRYYEKIGVLLPVYVNPDSGYRYYTYSQVQLVLSIQFYVNLGIPLQTLHQFIDPASGKINFADQISYGMEAAREHIADLEKQISHAQSLLSEIERCENLLNQKDPQPYEMPEKYCVAIPFTGTMSEQTYYSLLHQLLVEARKQHIITQGETGILCNVTSDTKECYVFSEIQIQSPFSLDYSGKIKELHLPRTTYWCKCSPFIDISDDSFVRESISKDFQNITFILTELFNRQFDYKEMFFELRWAD